MAENKESWWSKHLTGALQCFFGLYCAAFATLAYFYPRSAPSSPPPPATAAPQGGASMTTTSYSMPLYLWIGIVCLALSVIIPAVVRMVRKRREPDSPQRLRERLVTLIGDLCGYLFEHGKELNPPDDPASTGFEVIPDDPEIAATFHERFGERLAAARSGLGNVGMLLGDTARVLQDGANNANDVRRIIQRLKDSIGFLDTSCGTKVKAVEVIVPPNNGLFNPLQIEAFELARKLREWRRISSNPPTYKTQLFEPFIEKIVGKNFLGAPSEMDNWRVRLNGGYVADFSQSIKIVVHRFAKENITDPYIDQYFERITNEDDIREVERRLISLAHKVNGFDLEIPHDAGIPRRQESTGELQGGDVPSSKDTEGIIEG